MVAKHHVVVLVLAPPLPGPLGVSLNEERVVGEVADEPDARDDLPGTRDLHHLVDHRAGGSRSVLREQRNADDFVDHLSLKLGQYTSLMLGVW